jgi:hypothetical protein
MRDLVILLVHVITTILRLLRPGGVRAVVAESVLAEHQLLVLSRSRRRAPNLRIVDRMIAGFCSLWIQPRKRCLANLRGTGCDGPLHAENHRVWNSGWRRQWLGALPDVQAGHSRCHHRSTIFEF